MDAGLAADVGLGSSSRSAMLIHLIGFAPGQQQWRANQMRQRLHVQEHSTVRQYADCLAWQRPGVQDRAAGSHQLAVMRAMRSPRAAAS